MKLKASTDTQNRNLIFLQCRVFFPDERHAVRMFFKSPENLASCLRHFSVVLKIHHRKRQQMVWKIFRYYLLMAWHLKKMCLICFIRTVLVLFDYILVTVENLWDEISFQELWFHQCPKTYISFSFSPPLHVTVFLSLFLDFISLALSNTPSLCFSLDDHSRVILQPIEDDPSSDYINANYIDVSGNASNATIGSQRNQRNHTPSLVCQASIPLLRLLVIHRAILRIKPHRSTSYIQYMCLSQASVLRSSSCPCPCFYVCIFSEFIVELW